ncbi:MAG TPA: KamA family radical SAM protein [Chloroflexia bacterium]|nr:KamA family radical SAM protein [Chloroflexia bacterium]
MLDSPPSPYSAAATSMPGARLTWQAQVRASIRTAADLRRAVGRDRLPDDLTAVLAAYKMGIPPYYLGLIDWDDPRDPIRLQAVAAPAELVALPEEMHDPIGDARWSPVPRLTHRYPDRALIYPTYLCSMYCRFCFRKERLNEAEAGFPPDGLAPALEYIATHPAIHEVILTGGDPLMLADDKLAGLLAQLAAIPHLDGIRLHTRVPVTLPMRVTDGLCTALASAKMLWIVTHFNHPRELTPEAIAACEALHRAGARLLNQNVLLKGVNDSAETLAALYRGLVYRAGVKPYYLHHCDMTLGVGQFRTTIDHGLEIMKALRGHVSGLCIPTYVLDIPGGAGKSPLGPSYVRARDGADWQIESYTGTVHSYRDTGT